MHENVISFVKIYFRDAIKLLPAQTVKSKHELETLAALHYEKTFKTAN